MTPVKISDPADLSVGDRVSFLHPDENCSFYEITSADGDRFDVRFCDSAGDWSEFSSAPITAQDILDEQPWLLNPKEKNTITPTVNQDAEIAKLDLAVEHSLRVRFSYTNEKGETHDVRLEPEDRWYTGGEFYVGGESYNEDGDEDGYKQYRLDRINGKVAVR